MYCYFLNKLFLIGSSILATYTPYHRERSSFIKFLNSLLALSRLEPKPLNHRLFVAGLCMLYKVDSSPRHCLNCNLPSACQRVRRTRAADAAHPFEFMVARCWISQFARCFLSTQVPLWKDLPFSVFVSGTLNGFTGAVNSWLLP